jgi:hypothetical protein
VKAIVKAVYVGLATVVLKEAAGGDADMSLPRRTDRALAPKAGAESRGLEDPRAQAGRLGCGMRARVVAGRSSATVDRPLPHI